jgi:RNA polymerase sigma-70 factor (ECF subfamily)
MTAVSDETALLERIRAGDKAACDECILRHRPGVYRLALRLMRDEAEAEDLVQEAFLQAFRGIDRFDGRAELSTWLYRITTNAARMRRRRAEPAQVPVDDTDDPTELTRLPRALFDWCCLPEPELGQAELHAQLKRAIRAMPDGLRAVFLLRVVEGASTQATADALGVSEEVVKTRLRRARIWLRERLTADLEPFTDPAGGSSDSIGR